MRLSLVLLTILGALATAGGPSFAAAPTNPVLDLARAREAADDAAGAATALEPYVAAHPADAAAGRLLGDLFFRSRDTRRAEAAWLAVLAVHPDDMETHARLGASYAAGGRYFEAAVQYQAQMPNVNAAAALVRLHQRLGDLPRFLDDTAFLAEQYRFSAGDLLQEATVLQAVHREAAALDIYQRVVALRPGDVAMLVMRAGDLVAMHRNAEAIADLRAALADHPDSYDALVLLASTYLDAGDASDARPCVDAALALNPSGYAALIDRGVIDDGDGQIAAAMRDDEAAIAADPLVAEGYANLGYDLIESRALTAAESTLLAGLRAAPDVGRLHYLLARAYELDGKPAAVTRAQYVAALGSDESAVVRAARTQLQLLQKQGE